jgi:hypothetical protein
MPAIDQNVCAYWPEQDQNTYNKLPYYLDKAEALQRPMFETFEPMMTDTIDWTPNMADTLKLVMTENAPILRQSARPNSLAVQAKGDIFNVRERTSTASLVWQKFFSPKFRFLPAFQDFMKGQLVPTRKNIEMQIRWFKEVFYRTYMWDYSPYVYVCGTGLIPAPVGRDSSGNSLKTAAWLESIITAMGAQSVLSYQEVYRLASAAITERGTTPYAGSATPAAGTGEQLRETYCLITSNEAYMQFVNDPWVKEYRPIQLDIVNNKFKPTPFGSVAARIEKYPLRFASDVAHAVTEAAPETIVTDASSSEYNRTIPNPGYSKIDQSQVEVGWFMGEGGGYRRINVGAPPEMFAGGTTDMAKIAGMEWNGRVYATKNFPIQCVDANGTTQLDLNSFGEYLRFQASLTLGCVSVNPQNCIPVIYQRRRGVTTTGLPGAGI